MSMDNSSDTQMLGLSVEDDHRGQTISFEDGTSIGTKRFHLDSESSEVGSLSCYMMDKRIKMENTSEDDASSGLINRNSCDESVVELEDEGDMILGSTPEGISSNGGDMTFSPEDENGDEDGCVLIHHMDIKEPLINLKKALEETHGISLEGYEFYLQDTTLAMVLTVQDFSDCLCMCNQFSLPDDYPVQLSITPCNSTLLAGHKNLVEQCVQGCGTVQINLQLKIEDDGTKKINIIDVLKPSDSYLLATGNPAFSPDLPELPEEPSQPAAAEEEPEPEPSSDKNLIRWVVDHNFKANQQRLQIPQDPMEWLVPHVRHWLLWAVRQFNLTGIKLADWKISGATLCNLTLDDFKARVPYDPSDIFWTHLELLRRCKFVAVMQNPEEQVKQEIGELKPKASELDKNIMRGREKKAKAAQQVKSAVLMDSNATLNQQTNWGNRTVSGNNGQVQLWQFLLDLLTDKDHRECIQWLGAEGEFKLIEPERVARLWGARKNKPSMNYEKLSRALRYYYDGDMIAKVHGKRFVYKFVCDLKQLLGYSAFELNRLVIEAEMRAQNASNDPLQHSIFGNREFSS